MKRVPFQSDFQRNEKTDRTTAKGIITQEGRCDKWEKGEETEPGLFTDCHPGNGVVLSRWGNGLTKTGNYIVRW